MSIYHPASQVFRLNRDGVLRHPDPDLLRVLEQARQLRQWSGATFDITVLPLWRAFRGAADLALASSSLPVWLELTQRRCQKGYFKCGTLR